MAVDLLTDAKARNAKPKASPYYLADGRGLSLYVSPAGSRLWRFRYRFGGKPRTLTLGEYPGLSLAEARGRHARARQALRDGRNPASVQSDDRAAQARNAADNFERVAREWHTITKARWTDVHAGNVLDSLEKDVFPTLGNKPLRDITPAMVIEALRKVEARSAIETAHRIQQRVSMVFGFAVAGGRCDVNPAAIVKQALAPLPPKGRQPAVKSLDEARQVLVSTASIPASPVTKLAMRFLALTAVRPGTLAATLWDELGSLDPDKPVWRIPAARMKLKKAFKDDEAHDHLVPLSPDAVEILEVLKPLTGQSPFLFPNDRHIRKPMSENALSFLLKRAGYSRKHVPHGWRSTFSTIMNERRRHDKAVIDLMLAHLPEDAVEAAYNRAEHMELRREIANEWAAILLEGLPPASDLLNGRRN
ncbi:tyrosine-type recombinase/integrase [Hyphomicrobium sp.]|uniref:tyrosine-type recombinase/integrase n=1 Tax=Hyphomicrobium sp. TaxID=82 RepID=UPI003565383C